MGRHLRTLIVSFLAIALLWWFLRHSNLGDVWDRIRAARMRELLLGFSLFLPMMVIRAIRWRYLLQPVGPARFSTALRTTMIGFAASNILPARVGEVLRPYLLAREERLNATSAFATIVLERVLDLMAVLVLMATFIFGSTHDNLRPALMVAVRTSAAIASAAGMAIAVILTILASHPERIGHVVLRAGRVLPHRFAHALSRIARTFSEGLAVARAPRALALAIVWSFALWISIALQTWLVTRGFGIDMPPTGAFLLQALLVIGIAVPTPGGVGGYHEAYRIGTTTFFGASNDAAVGAALVLHAMTFFPVTFVGVALMLRDGLSLQRLQGLARTASSEEIPAAP